MASLASPPISGSAAFSASAIADFSSGATLACSALICAKDWLPTAVAAQRAAAKNTVRAAFLIGDSNRKGALHALLPFPSTEMNSITRNLLLEIRPATPATPTAPHRPPDRPVAPRCAGVGC